ncbi:MAG: hypothetical protein ACE5PT_05190 [Gemmatimonadales bacterium]
MNRLRVILQNTILRNVVCPRDWGPLMVALATKERDVHDRGGRTGISVRPDVVCPVTVRAAWSQGVPPGSGLPVQGARVLFALRTMTQPAVNRWKLSGMRELAHLVAHCALETGGTVNRACDFLGIYHKTGGVLPRGEEGRVPVAHEARFVPLRNHRTRRERCYGGDNYKRRAESRQHSLT